LFKDATRRAKPRAGCRFRRGPYDVNGYHGGGRRRGQRQKEAEEEAYVEAEAA
jgi:hypothetical protein